MTEKRLQSNETSQENGLENQTVAWQNGDTKIAKQIQRWLSIGSTHLFVDSHCKEFKTIRFHLFCNNCRDCSRELANKNTYSNT